jgi:hypothetical protein
MGAFAKYKTHFTTLLRIEVGMRVVITPKISELFW